MPGASAAEVDARIADFTAPLRHAAMLRWMGVPCDASANDLEMSLAGELLEPPAEHIAEATRYRPVNRLTWPVQ